MKFKKVIVCGMILLGIGIFAYKPYYQTNILTDKYGNQFKKRYEDVGLYENIEYFKVIKYKQEDIKMYCSNSYIRTKINNLSDEYAVILYVEKGHSSVSLFAFKNSKEGDWKLDNWYTVWSSSGSADGITWPFYR